MGFGTQESKNVFSKALIATYEETTPKSTMIQAQFEEVMTDTLNVSIEVQRNGKRIAVDVQRGGAANYSQRQKFTEKIFQPPLFNEATVVSAQDAYTRAFGAKGIGSDIAALIRQVNADIKEKKDAISLAVEKMCIEVLEDGTVTTKHGDLIDYGRKAASKVDLGAGEYWTEADADIEQQLIDSAEFIRNKGNSAANEFDLQMTSNQWVLLKETDFFKNNATYNNVVLNDIKKPIATGTGGSGHGQITAGSYIFNLWTYDAVYDDGATTDILLRNNKKSVITPVSTDKVLKLVYCGIALIGANGMPFVAKGKFLMHDFIDQKMSSYEVYTKSAPLPIPVKVDQCVTLQTIA